MHTSRLALYSFPYYRELPFIKCWPSLAFYLHPVYVILKTVSRSVCCYCVHFMGETGVRFRSLRGRLRKISAGLILGSGGLSLGCLSNPWPQILPLPYHVAVCPGPLLVPGHLYEIGTFLPDPEDFSSWASCAAMSVPGVTISFPLFCTNQFYLCPISPIKAVSRSPCFYSLYSFQDLPVSSYYPSGILQ